MSNNQINDEYQIYGQPRLPGTPCHPLKAAIKNDDIEQIGNEYRIHGRPQSVDEGGGYIIDTTERLTITHCPFCGKKLSLLSAMQP